jgi:hypothetical protein
MFKGTGLSKCLASASMPGKELVFPYPMKAMHVAYERVVRRWVGAKKEYR